jgi:hypothetical protein
MRTPADGELAVEVREVLISIGLTSQRLSRRGAQGLGALRAQQVEPEGRLQLRDLLDQSLLHHVRRFVVRRAGVVRGRHRVPPSCR